MKKPNWVIEIDVVTDSLWTLYSVALRHRSGKFWLTNETFYSRRDSAIRGAKRLAKALRIRAEIKSTPSHDGEKQ